MQPPPRGCVLKQTSACHQKLGGIRAAASARLCVETNCRKVLLAQIVAAASARLCVETHTDNLDKSSLGWQPPPRGCVLKLCCEPQESPNASAAASARLCVET